MLVKTSIMLLSLLVMTSCSWCEREVIVKVKVPYKVHVPQKCLVPEPLGCNWSNVEDYEVPVKMAECIIELKKNSEVCQ